MQVPSTQAPVRINTKRRQAHAGSRRHHELHAHLRRRNVLYFRAEEQHIPQLWSIVHAPQWSCARIARSIIQQPSNRTGCIWRAVRPPCIDRSIRPPRIDRSIQQPCKRTGCIWRAVRPPYIVRSIQRLCKRTGYIWRAVRPPCIVRSIQRSCNRTGFIVKALHPRFYHAVRYHWLLRRCRRG